MKKSICFVFIFLIISFSVFSDTGFRENEWNSSIMENSYFDKFYRDKYDSKNFLLPQLYDFLSKNHFMANSYNNSDITVLHFLYFDKGLEGVYYYVTPDKCNEILSKTKNKTEEIYLTSHFYNTFLKNCSHYFSEDAPNQDLLFMRSYELYCYYSVMFYEQGLPTRQDFTNDIKASSGLVMYKIDYNKDTNTYLIKNGDINLIIFLKKCINSDF